MLLYLLMSDKLLTPCTSVFAIVGVGAFSKEVRVAMRA